MIAPRLKQPAFAPRFGKIQQARAVTIGARLSVESG
jgi:hypothetical protein